jgi:hypothetical protein
VTGGRNQRPDTICISAAFLGFMSDLDQLFLILIAFYVGESAIWIRPGTFVVTSQLGGWFRITDLGWALLRNHAGGVRLGNLSPLGETFVCEQWPLSIAPTGVYAFVCHAFGDDGRPDGTERFILFRDLRKVEWDDRRLFLNGVYFARFATADNAAASARTLQRLMTLPEDRRSDAIRDAIREHFDAESANHRLQSFRRRTRDLRVTCATTVFLTLIYPQIVAFYAPFVQFAPLLFAYVMLMILAQLQFRAAERELTQWGWKDRLKNLLVMLVSPADVMHARDKLSRPLLARYHPLVVAWLTCSPHVVRELAEKAWRDISFPMHPVCPSPDPEPAAVEMWFRNLFSAEFETFLRKAHLLPASIKHPDPLDGQVRAFCQRCLGQYERVDGGCYNCGDRPLTAFARHEAHTRICGNPDR